jgi:dinuclear metal center YbgI/SA1388 family protein
MTLIADVMAVLDQRYPPQLADDWDAVGLAVGDPSRQVTLVHFAVDPTLEVIAEAAAAGAQLLVTHHPLILRGVTSVAANTAKGAAVHALIEAGMAQFAAHTNADAAAGGVAESLALALGMEVEGPLVPAAEGSGGTGAGDTGTGRVGSIVPTSLRAFAQAVARALPSTAGGVLFAGDPDGVVRRVAVVGGAGDSFIDAAVAAGVDAYVTADLRHHPVLEAREAANVRDGRPYFVNVSHAASEGLWLDAAARAVADSTGVRTYVSTLNTDPWTGRVGHES